MSRIYGETADINHEKIRDFFEKRFDKDHPLSSVMLRNSEDHIAENRNHNEKILMDRLLADAKKPLSVLDIGCGMGRWATNLLDRIAVYDGVDFTTSYVDASNELFKDYPHIRFYQGLASEIDQQPLQLAHYDLIIIAGLLIYMNDNDVNKLMNITDQLLADDGMFYIRESISVIDQRLTLKDFHSDELNADYNAIYRTTAEYEKIFDTHLHHLKLQSSGLMLDKTLGAREETNQRHWFFKRS